MQTSDPVSTQIVLVGGGHTHALVLRMLAMRPLPGVRVVLVSEGSRAPYSGMLPGCVAGAYLEDEMHIDLRRLCNAAGAIFVQATVTGLALERRQVYLAGRPPLAYDLVSLNVGSVPARQPIAGATAHATPAKPVAGLLAAWSGILAAQAAGMVAPAVVVVGGGAGGVELALGMAHQLKAPARVTLVEAGARLLPSLARGASRIVTRLAHERGIELCLGDAVTQVAAGALTLHSGRTVPFDHLFWATGAAPAPWLRAAGLAVDGAGFVQVHATLQSVSHPTVFAVGDTATVVGAARPRSGVYAVRQARPLERNLRRWLAGRPLVPAKLQRHALVLIGTADEHAVAVRGSFTGRGRAWWRLKDRIDRRFMRLFADLRLPEAPQSRLLRAWRQLTVAGAPRSAAALPNRPAAGLALDRARAALRCGGCAAKVGGDVLSAALGRLRAELAASGVDLSAGGGVLVGLADHADAAVLRVPAGQVLVQSVDFLPALLSDPYLFGRISAAHACSDIFAMGAEPQSAQAFVNVPFGAAGPTAELVYQLLSGVVATLGELGAVLVGGHTTEAPELALGLVANGTAAAAAVWGKGGLAAGQVLILTKAVGTGTLFAAAMQLKADARWIDTAVGSMLQTNQAAAAVLRRFGAAACTDVTGFGLLGHLEDLVRASGVRVELELSAVPLLPGAAATVQLGLLSTLHSSNAQRPLLTARAGAQLDGAYPLLFDPQTSGGLLAGVPAAEAAACIAALRVAGYTYSAVVGRVTGGGEACVHVF